MRCPGEIAGFIKANKVATVCYVKDALPECFNCLYACMPYGEGIVFKSSLSSLHSTVMQQTLPVAGTIYRSSESGLDNSGIQFHGNIVTGQELREIAQRVYYKRYPLGLVVPGELFVVLFDNLKYTKTIKGIRKKQQWERAMN